LKQGFTEDTAVTDKSQVLAGTLLGAVVGGAAGYLLFTEGGRSLRRQLEAAVEDMASELSGFRVTAQKAASVATEGWKFVSEALGESGQSPRYPSVPQSAPF
jgi:gas vesicle protein